MNSPPHLEDPIAEQGFPAWIDVSGRGSIVDLFPSKRTRSGIYVLGFADGERYVGKTVDVVRRFAEHRRTHLDISTLTFQRIALSRQGDVERSFIHRLEAASLPLRNKAEMSVISGDRDLDLVVSPVEQERWLRTSALAADATDRAEDPDLRRRYRGQFARFQQLDLADNAVRILARYVSFGLPAPARTALFFWTLSCLPSHRRASVLARLNLNMQEVLTLFADRGELVGSFHLAISPFRESFGASWRRQLLARGSRPTITRTSREGTTSSTCMRSAKTASLIC